MKLMRYLKDGGSQSRVSGFFFIEIKPLFSIALLHFKNGSRDAYHSHAFNSWSWLLTGKLTERNLTGKVNFYVPSLRIIKTLRSTFHQVVSAGDSWVFTLRGPWHEIWEEFLPEEDKFIRLTHGRRIVGEN